MRICKYAATDARFLTDCRQCAIDAGSRDVVEGVTPTFPGSPKVYERGIYPTATYPNLPKRESFGCDWPYAVRRYNGAGKNSYNYQAHVIGNVRDLKL